MKNYTLDALKNQEELLWINPHKTSVLSTNAPLSLEDIESADARLRRFGSFFTEAFDDVGHDGLIESPLTPLENFQKALVPFVGGRILGKWYLKRDDLLPLAGSVKARGGVYEIIKWAESIADSHNLLDASTSYECFLTPKFQSIFEKYTVYVGSTGNLGLSIGTISRALGFKVKVHMSQDAKTWKIAHLKAIGADVILHESDYSKAVAEGRKEAEADPNAYFVDDENSLDLFTGYATAAIRLKEQLQSLGHTIDASTPLFIYLPCGVGGAPGGIAYAIKLIFGENAYVFFAEPTKAPCMLYGMSTQKHQSCHISELGLDGLTVADGLAVGSPSGFVGKLLTPLLDGIYTLEDDKMLWLVHLLNLSENIEVEPSATAGLLGPVKLFYTESGFNHLLKNQLLEKMDSAIHISWSTGGRLVPEDQMASYLEQGKKIVMDAL